MFFYSDTAKYDGPNIDPSKCDATKIVLNHYSNLLLLKVMMGDASSSVSEKAQARKETAICERKIKYWERQARYDSDAALKGMDAMKKMWGGRV